jgi:hypothetical protein
MVKGPAQTSGISFEHEHDEAAGGDGGTAHAMEERLREKVPGV